MEIIDTVRQTRRDLYKRRRKKEMVRTAKKVAVMVGAVAIFTAIIKNKHRV